MELIHFGLLAVITFLSALLYRRFPIASRPASTTTLLVDTKVSDTRTYRIQGVPIAWDRDQLQSFLADYDGCHDPITRSLALEAHGRSQTGTVTFRNGTQPPLMLRQGLQLCDNTQNLMLDDSFLGLTTLFTPSPEDHQIEWVFWAEEFFTRLIRAVSWRYPV